ncbi:DgyrCDS2839 [Dimorphilus gyrociliatus]|uniref:DgyrCDS2839 n=1 Tax=Dimorphilus gyrociliatus TaxID=2664684 RepID=A0A7I8VEH6_9ANNE|nr:DgyrCDS2839 [Dimorphilus gyrociliatus]
MLEEQGFTKKQQSNWWEDEIRRLAACLKESESENQRLKNEKEKLTLEIDLQSRNFLVAIDNLKLEKMDLMGRLHEEIDKVKNLLSEMDTMKSDMFKCEQEFQQSRVKADQSEILEKRVTKLQKELLLMGELQQQYKSRLAELKERNAALHEAKIQLDSLSQHEEALKAQLNQKTRESEVNRATIEDLTSRLNDKELHLREIKADFEQLQHKSDRDIEALKSHLSTRYNIESTLNAEIIYLKAELDKKTQERGAASSARNKVIASGESSNSPSYENVEKGVDIASETIGVISSGDED